MWFCYFFSVLQKDKSSVLVKILQKKPAVTGDGKSKSLKTIFENIF